MGACTGLVKYRSMAERRGPAATGPPRPAASLWGASRRSETGSRPSPTWPDEEDTPNGSRRGRDAVRPLLSGRHLGSTRAPVAGRRRGGRLDRVVRAASVVVVAPPLSVAPRDRVRLLACNNRRYMPMHRHNTRNHMRKGRGASPRRRCGSTPPRREGPPSRRPCTRR